MTAKADLVEQMLGICPEQGLERLTRLTRELVGHRDSPQSERCRFEGTVHRGITGFSRHLLPPWERVLVTGGTGCIGSMVLSHLGRDLPGARLVSMARRPPAPERCVRDVTYLQGDVRDLGQVTDVMEDVRPDLVIHLAAQRNPALAEQRVAETVSTNVVGSQVILDAAGEVGVDTVVIASTGKAVRLFTGDVYAATKKLVEYQAAVTARRYAMNVSCTRFTHVVDNSIVGQRVQRWIANNEPILLHSPLVQLPVQSALESYQLLMMAGVAARDGRPSVVALRDLGWPPVALLDLTLDYLADSPDSKSPIVFTGYPRGYEADAYPGTYDPLTAGDVSPLVNCIEAMRTCPAPELGDSVDYFEMSTDRSAEVDKCLRRITETCQAKRKNDATIGRSLRGASMALFQHSVEQADPEYVNRVHHLGRRHDPLIDDHAYIHQQLKMFVGAEHGAFA